MKINNISKMLIYIFGFIVSIFIVNKYYAIHSYSYTFNICNTTVE